MATKETVSTLCCVVIRCNEANSNPGYQVIQFVPSVSMIHLPTMEEPEETSGVSTALTQPVPYLEEPKVAI